MKLSLPEVLLVVALGFGCATRQRDVFFKPIPGPSDAPSEHLIPPPPAAVITNAVVSKPAVPKVVAPKPPEPAPVPKATKPVKEAKKEKPSKAIITPDLTLTGKVALYNDAGRFVILRFPLGQMPNVGDRMYVYRNDLKVGELKVTGPQRDANTVADVITGEAQTGDEVRDR